MSTPSTPESLPRRLWAQRIPLLITHPDHPTKPFVISVPRFSYLALLLPRLSVFFQRSCSSFHHETLLLRNLPLGLLADLYQPALPWRLTVHDGVSWDIADTFLNSVKEADFVRHGNANQIMKMSKDHTTALWAAVRDNDLAAFTKVNQILLNAPTALRHVPIRIYVPTTTASQPIPKPPDATAGNAATTAGTFKVVQTLIPSTTPDRRPQTLGTALKNVLPALFPSSRDPIHGEVIMHGAPVPFAAPVGELMKEAAYPDGWICLVVQLF
ncbi:Autophagy protein 5 [Ceratocystis lukuohia]|uniref:Autophagy protein 5 n=2 Tax=Ceratocystis TaxID=5157 RepID=A0A2C5X526_9PEZI|nr:Autophagy-related protein 5 [Ceratocystis fimbriata CBS 114723]